MVGVGVSVYGARFTMYVHANIEFYWFQIPNIEPKYDFIIRIAYINSKWAETDRYPTIT